MKKWIPSLILIFVSSASLALTFDEASKVASQNSREIKILRLQTESAKWGERKALSRYLPKVEIHGRHLTDERFEELEVPFNGDVFVMPAIQPYSLLGVTATLNIFDGFHTTHEFAAARASQRAAQYRLKRAEDQNRAQIRTLFYTALGSQILVDVANQSLLALQNHLNDINVRVRSGVSTRYDSLRVEVQLEEAKTEKVAAENAVVLARARLFESLGVPDDGKPLTGQMPEDFAKIDVNNMQLADGPRLDRAALIAERDSLRSHSKAAKSHWYPSVSLFGNYEWYNNINHSITESDERFKSAYAVGLNFTWDIYDGGADWASQKQALLESQMAELKLAQLEQNIPAHLDEAKRHFSYNVLNYKAKVISSKKAEEAVRLAKGGLRAGTRTNTEVLDTVVDWNRSRAAVVKSQLEAIQALGDLELAAGRVIQ